MSLSCIRISFSPEPVLGDVVINPSFRLKQKTTNRSSLATTSENLYLIIYTQSLYTSNFLVNSHVRSGHCESFEHFPIINVPIVLYAFFLDEELFRPQKTPLQSFSHPSSPSDSSWSVPLKVNRLRQSSRGISVLFAYSFCTHLFQDMLHSPSFTIVKIENKSTTIAFPRLTPMYGCWLCCSCCQCNRGFFRFVRILLIKFSGVQFSHIAACMRIYGVFRKRGCVLG